MHNVRIECDNRDKNDNDEEENCDGSLTSTNSKSNAHTQICAANISPSLLDLCFEMENIDGVCLSITEAGILLQFKRIDMVQYASILNGRQPNN